MNQSKGSSGITHKTSITPTPKPDATANNPVPSGENVSPEEREARLRREAELDGRKLQDLLQQAPAAIALLSGPEHRWVYVNQEYVRVTGRKSAEDFIGKTFVESLPELQTQVYVDLLDEVYRTGETYTGREARVTLIRGAIAQPDEAYFDFVYQPVRNADGQIEGILVHAVEVTEKVKVRRAIERNEERFRALANAIPQLVWMANPDGAVFWYNQRWYAYTGATPQEIEGWGWQSVHDPAVLPVVLERWKTSIASGEPFEMTFPLRGVDGVFRPFLTRGVPVRDEQGRIIRWFGTSTDISVEVEARNELRNVQQRLETALINSQKLAAIVESSDDAIVSKDLNGVVQSWNRSAERLFGYKAEEIIGRSILLIIPPELQSDEDMILGKIRAGEKIDHFETVRVAKSGERLDVSLSISPVRDDQGRIIGAAKIARDITQNKKIEHALRTTEKLAAAGRLAATVAHEINNPLEAVTNLVFLARRDLPNGEKVAKYLQMAGRELDRVAHIARQTLGFYRDTSSPTTVRVIRTLDDLLLLYDKRFETRKITVQKQYESELEITALAGEIRQAFSNLVSNAVDAMPSGGSLIIRVAKSRRWDRPDIEGVRITFMDTGSG
ncbi:MAG TPA: PAS domain S-box protein, partial [Candidatus Angelobacter sp.]|nr:PAS domain S-box protein [Candidatus Angelobacter sp.]